MNKSVRLDFLFDPTVYSSKRSLSDYLVQNKIKSSDKEIKEVFERILLFNLKRVGCIMFKRMQLANDYVSDTPDQVTETFFSQSIFKQDINVTEPDISKQIETLFTKQKINSLSLEQCVQQTKQLHFEFNGYSFKNSNIEIINRILRYIGSSYVLVTSSVGLWLRFFLLEIVPYKNDKNCFVVTKEHFFSPTVNTTLAAFTLDKKVYLRNSTFEFMYNMKWQYHYENTESFPSYFNIDSYIISTAFQKIAVENKLSLAAPEFKKEIKSMIMDNVVYHENGHLIINEFLEADTKSLMKSFKIYPLSFFESCDEILADCAPLHNEIFGTLTGISIIAETNPDLAKDMFFVYLSDTWFFDTTAEDMFEYSEMIHLIMLRYFDPKNKTIKFAQMKKDFDLNNPRSFLTKFVTSMNSLIREFRLYLKKQTYIVADQKKTYGWLETFSENEIKEKHPHASPNSMFYYNQFWKRIILLVKAFLKDTSKIDAFCSHSKKKLYTILFRLTTKDNLKPDQARQYIMDKYKTILPHYLNENPFETSVFN